MISNNMNVIYVFLDIPKAINMLWRTGLLMRLTHVSVHAELYA